MSSGPSTLDLLRTALETAAQDFDELANAADPFDDAVGTQDHSLLLTLERRATQAGFRARAALLLAEAALEPSPVAYQFYGLANELKSCIDPLTGEREARDLRRVASRAAKLGDQHRRTRLPEPVPLAECPVGLFLADSGALCVRTQYGSNEGRIDAYIVESGEMFWGSPPQSIARQRSEPVRPIPLEIVADCIALPLPAPRVSTPDHENAELYRQAARTGDPRLMGALLLALADELQGCPQESTATTSQDPPPRTHRLSTPGADTSV